MDRLSHFRTQKLVIIVENLDDPSQCEKLVFLIECPSEHEEVLVKKVALLVAGCGFKDGAEITEVVSSWVALTELGVEVEAFSIDLEIEPTSYIKEGPFQKRNLLEESARIFRAKMKPLADLHVSAFDALVIAGGFGVALYFCDWAQKGAKCTIHPEVEKTLREFYQQQKPIGAWCIAPTLLARAFGNEGPTLTIGDDAATAAEINLTGAHHVACEVDDFVSDRAHRFISTPAFMFGDASPHLVFRGIQKACRELVEMA